MAGAKQLARKAIMSDAPLPEPKPQRTPGVAFFTPRPNRDAKVSKTDMRKPGPTDSKPDTGSKGPSAPSGLRKYDTEKGNVKQVSGHLGRDAAKPSGPPRNVTRSAGNDKEQHHEVYNVDTTGMSNSWYEGDSDDEIDNHGGAETQVAEIDNHGGGETHVAEIDNHGGGETHDAEIDKNGGGALSGAAIDNHGGAAPQPGNRDYNDRGAAAAPMVPDEANAKPPQNRRGNRRRNNRNAPVNEQGEFRYYFGGNTGQEDNASPPNGKIVTRSGWKTPQNKKRKRERSGSKTVPPLRAAVASIRRELYVQGLDYSECSCHADFEDMVVEFCKSQGVKIIDACTIPKGKSRVEAGCKVTVRECDYAQLSDPDFWPGDSTVRPWTQRPRGGRRENDASDASD